MLPLKEMEIVPQFCWECEINMALIMKNKHHQIVTT